MPATFNGLLNEAGIDAHDVRLLRHKDRRAIKGRTIYELWSNDRPSFEQYQSLQQITEHKKLSAPYWASFVGTPDKETLFVGLYSVEYLGLLDQDTPWPHGLAMDAKGSVDKYKLTLVKPLSGFIGELFVEWGDGYRAWIQYASNQDKPIIGGTADRDLADDLVNIIRQPNTNATTKETLVAARLGQGKFRQDVLDLWGGRCSVSGSSTLAAIRASHIKPWRDSTNDERLDPNNGLPLIASLDALFDAGLISFEASGRMLVSGKLKSAEQSIFGLGGKSLSKKPSKETASYLDHHHKRFFPK